MPRAAKKASNAPALSNAAQKLKILGNPIRLCVLGAIADGEGNVSSLAIHLGMTPPAVSQHISLLRMAKFIEKSRNGVRVDYTLTDLGRAFWELAEKLIS